MAQYDGSIRINTNINTDGIVRGMVEIRQAIERGMSASKPMKNTEQEVKQLGDSMSDTAQKASELKNAMESQKNAQVPTKEYSDLEKEVNSLEKKLFSVYDRQEKFLATGGKEDSSTYQRMVYDAEALEKKLQNAEQAMETLVNSGKAFTLGADSDAEYWKQQEENIDRIIARLEEKRQKEAETPPELLQPRYDRPEVESWQRGAGLQEGQRMAQALADAMTSVGQNAQEAATKSNEAIASMTQELAELKARQKELESQGQGLGFEEYDANVQRIAEINDALSNYRRELTDTEVSYRELGNVASNVFKQIGKNIQKYAISPFISLGKIAAKTLLGIGKSAKSSNNMLNKGFKAILKYGLGIRSLYILVNKLRTGIKEGFSNLYNDRKMVDFKSQVDSLKASLLTLKNAFAAAFHPIVETVIPYIQRLIDYITSLLNVVGQFMAAIIGQKSYTKAIKQTTAAIEDQNKVQNRQLSGLDKLNNLTSSSGDGSDGSGVTDMFEKVPIEDKWKDLAQRLKDMWKKSDFYDLGKSIGEWLKNALDSIPWNEIKEKARKLGKSLATLINGFIEVEGLGYSIGRTLAEAFNVGFEFLNAFVQTLHWASVGHFLADGLNGLFENIDWFLIYNTFVTGFHGLALMINQFMQDFHWDNISEAIGHLVNTITTSLYTFFSTVKWSELGKNIGEQITKSIQKIDWEMMGRALGSIIQAALDFAINLMAEVDFGEAAQAIVDFLKGAFEKIDLGDLASVILTILTVHLSAKAVGWSFTTAATAIMSGLGSALASASGFVLSQISLIMGQIGQVLMTGASFVASLISAIAGPVAVFSGVILALVNFIKMLQDGFSWLNEMLMLLGIALAAVGAIILGAPALVAGVVAAIVAAVATLVVVIKDNFDKIKDFAMNIGRWFMANVAPWIKQIINFILIPLKIAVNTIGNILGTIINIVKDIFGLVASLIQGDWAGAWNNAVSIVTDIWDGILGIIKGAIDTIKGWIDDLLGLFGKVESKQTGMTSGGLGGALGGAFGKNNYSYGLPPAMAATLSNMEFPGYATGQVIPVGMKKHLAWLGDNTRETEVVSPLSTIKQADKEAVLEALSELGLSGNNGRSNGTIRIEIPLVVDGRELTRVVQNYDLQAYKKRGMGLFEH